MDAVERTLTPAVRSNAEVDEFKSVAIFCGLGLLLSLVAAPGIFTGVSQFTEERPVGGAKAKTTRGVRRKRHPQKGQHSADA